VADLSGSDAAVVSRLLAEYHAQTEAEKIAHGLRASGPMPAAYQDEIDDPAAAFAASTVLLAVSDAGPVGMIVARPDAEGVEVKRLWVTQRVRGGGVGTALLAAAAAVGDGPVRLSVWQWRADAIGLYEARGFRRAPSWESRPQLVCLIRDA
jgi:putative acetyltransferase